MFKYKIVGVRNNRPEGYIKSISYEKQSFSITKEKKNARNFLIEEIDDTIDTLTAFGYNKGYIFMYVPAE